jgi:hypothetical protein
MRPIVCCAGTMLNNLSRWLDYWFQKLKPLLPTYIKDSNQLLEELASLGALPPNAKLATADANSMYTNIEPDHAILVIGLWLDSLQTNTTYCYRKQYIWLVTYESVGLKDILQLWRMFP